MLELAVVIVNYNTCELLEACLQSVYASYEAPTYHIVVVDNGSTDGSVEMLRRRFPQATTIRSDRNGGFGYGNNLALRWLSRQGSPPDRGTVGQPLDESGPPDGMQPLLEKPLSGASSLHLPCAYVLFLNPDTLLPPDALARTVAFLEQHPDAGALGPKVVKLDGSLDLACRRSFPTPVSSLFKLSGLSKLFPRSRLVARYNLTFLGDDTTAEVDSVMGAYMLVRGESLEEAGLFDERFFMYGEDLDLAYRLKVRGWRVYYYPEVSVLHHKGASSRKVSQRSIREFYRAMHIFYRKHYARRYTGLVNALVYLGIAARGSVALARNAFRPAESKRVT
ncbi:MAG: glycosyltransferase family 2 protein [Chloroflexota bacterium]|nr:glycosyltransferase family 2 protein [Chloroflexota bacterium]